MAEEFQKIQNVRSLFYEAHRSNYPNCIICRSDSGIFSDFFSRSHDAHCVHHGGDGRVHLTAALLPKWQAFLALIVYLLLGAIGPAGIQRVSRRNRYPAGAHRWVSDGLSHHGVFGRMAPGAVGQNAAAPVCFLPDCAADYHCPLLPHRFPVVYAGGTGGLG